VFLVGSCIADFTYKISSICAVESDTLAVTTNEGYLLYVSISASDSQSYRIVRSRKIALNRSNSSFSSNPSLSPLQFVRFQNIRLVFLLVDSVLVAYELPNLELFPRQSSQLQLLSEKTSGAHVFSVNSWTENVAYIAVAARKRVRLLMLTSSQTEPCFVFTGEQDSADLPLAIRFGGTCSKKELCVSTLRDHIIYSVTDDGLLQVRNVVSMKSDLDTSRRTVESPSPSGNTSSFYILRRMKGLMSNSSTREPIALPLPDSDRWLLEMEQASVFRIFSSSQGFLNQVTFLSSENQVPLSVVFCRPFCIALYSRNQLVIRTLSNKGIGSIVQTIHLQNYVSSSRFFNTSCMIAPSCGDLVDSSVAGYAYWYTKVLKLFLREPIWEITKQLENEKQLQLALEIAESLPEDFGRERVYSLREALCLDALKKGNHSLAISFLHEMNISTKQVLELRDKYVPQSWKSALEEWAAFLASHYAKEMKEIRKRRGLTEDSIVDTLWIPGQDEVFSKVIEALLMAHVESKKLIELLKQLRCHIVQLDQWRSDAEYMPENEVHLFWFHLYHSAGCYEMALNTLERLIESSSDDIQNTYIHKLGTYLMELSGLLNTSQVILEHLQWYLDHGGDSEVMLQLLSKSFISLTDALDFLRKQPCNLLIRFLEQQIEKLIEDRRMNTRYYSILIDQLGKAYIDNYIYSKQSETSKTSDSPVEAKNKICDFICQRQGFDPQYVLRQLPQDKELYKERAFLVGQQGKYMEALHLLVEEGLDPEAAENFIRDTVPSHESREVWTQLVKMYLSMATSDAVQGEEENYSDTSKFVTRACQLVSSRDGVKVDCSRVIRELPNNIELKCIIPFLLSSLSNAIGLVRSIKVKKSLLKSEHLLLNDHLVQMKKQKIVIGRDRACCICNRKVGTSAIAVYSDHSVAHLLCHRKSSGRQIR